MRPGNRGHQRGRVELLADPLLPSPQARGRAPQARSRRRELRHDGRPGGHDQNRDRVARWRGPARRRAGQPATRVGSSPAAAPAAGAARAGRPALAARRLPAMAPVIARHVALRPAAARSRRSGREWPGRRPPLRSFCDHTRDRHRADPPSVGAHRPVRPRDRRSGAQPRPRSKSWNPWARGTTSR